MANMAYVTENKLTLKADLQRDRNRKVILTAGTVIAILTLYFHLYAPLFIFFMTMILYISQNGCEIVRAGAKGEDSAIKLLTQLPAEFTIYNQVEIPNSKSKKGSNEADLIVLGPSSIFVIEVKNNNSLIIGGETDKEWMIKKVGRGGTPYYKTMRNPISQVKKLAWLLSEELKSKNTKIWIQGIVLFSNDQAELSLSSDPTVPVLRNGELVDYIKNFKVRSNTSDLNRGKRELALLKGCVRS
jgi:hypothetical protein